MPLSNAVVSGIGRRRRILALVDDSEVTESAEALDSFNRFFGARYIIPSMTSMRGADQLRILLVLLGYIPGIGDSSRWKRS
jgi:hypothetical protein